MAKSSRNVTLPLGKGQDEKALYDELREERLRPRLRLERERVRFGWVEQALGEIRGRG